MQTNLPTLPTQGPMRSSPEANGNWLGSSAASFFKESGCNTLPAMSGTWALKSRIFPSLSKRPGFSRPFGP